MATRKARRIPPAMMAAMAAPSAAPTQGPAAPQVPAPGAGAMPGMKRGGGVKKMASGGSASSRADGIAMRGKTVGKYC
jgi:hypothetical protein